jgi:hypothetical protein
MAVNIATETNKLWTASETTLAGRSSQAVDNRQIRPDAPGDAVTGCWPTRRFQPDDSLPAGEFTK